MARRGLTVTPRLACKVTPPRKASDAVADNLRNQPVTPKGPNPVWAGAIPGLNTGEGWLYLADVMDWYSRRLVGGQVDHPSSALVSRALKPAYHVRQAPADAVFHSDRGSTIHPPAVPQVTAKVPREREQGGGGAC